LLAEFTVTAVWVLSMVLYKIVIGPLTNISTVLSALYSSYQELTDSWNCKIIYSYHE